MSDRIKRGIEHSADAAMGYADKLYRDRYDDHRKFERLSTEQRHIYWLTYYARALRHRLTQLGIGENDDPFKE